MTIFNNFLQKRIAEAIAGTLVPSYMPMLLQVMNAFMYKKTKIHETCMNQNGDPANGDCVQFFSNPMVEEMSNALSVKCEPCVLTDYTKLFVALDGILGADLDFEDQGRYLTCSVPSLP